MPPNLYSYTLRVDDGAAPNPYGGVCTLTICKPAIRRTAKKGDWIVGIGPTQTPDGRNLSSYVVYAMKVSKKLAYASYDEHCLAELTAKIPDWSSEAPFENQVGDCLYKHLGAEKFKQRKGVHQKGNVKTDIGGLNALLAEETFYYFGENAVEIPQQFRSMCHPYQGHKVHANEGIKADVIDWMLSGFGCDRRPRVLYGQPIHRAVVNPGRANATWKICGGERVEDDDEVGIC